ncbi:MAG: insulinase family protein [Candidatus Riflebacteria bacterium]|nr:insulinase family protein [Candidatus Riflebacteria bacterium]
MNNLSSRIVILIYFILACVFTAAGMPGTVDSATGTASALKLDAASQVPDIPFEKYRSFNEFKLPNASEPNVTFQIPEIAFEKYQLPNGLQVILHIDRKLPMVHVNSWFHVGSACERPGRTGFAHLFEHMMFQGSKNASGEYFTWAERAGANLREHGVNGTTSNDRTNFFATVPSGNLEHLIWLESDRLATLLDGMTQEKLDNQREVVRNERRRGQDNVPYGHAEELIVSNLFPSGHPYSWTVIGSHEDLKAATLDDVKEFFRAWYSPNNLSLCISGNFDPAEAKRFIEKYYGSIPPGPAPIRRKRWVPHLDSVRLVDAHDRVPQDRVFITWPTSPMFEPGDAELDVAAGILGEGLSARLTKRLVYEKELCSELSVSQSSMEICGMFQIDATARPGVSLIEIERAINEEIARLTREGPTPAELSRVKTRREFSFVTNLERIGGFGGKADQLNAYNTFMGDPNGFAKDIDRYKSMTAEHVKTALGFYINNKNCLIVRFHKEASGRTSVAEPDRSKPPALGSDTDYCPPEIKTSKLPNGLDILVVERPEIPKVSVNLVIRSGCVFDSPDKSGAASLLSSTITRGTKTRSALEIDEAFADLGSSLGSGIGREHAGLGFEILKRNLASGVALMADVALNPTFPVSEVERERNKQLDEITQQETNPNGLAGRIGPMLLFGAGHPYGLPEKGFFSSVASLTRDDLTAIHAKTWKAGNAAIIFVGAITLEEATKLAADTFGGWDSGPASKLVIPPLLPAGFGKIYLVDRQDAAQTVVTQILPAPDRKNSGYYALSMADAVWGGGGFGTRLLLNLREDKGYTYSVRSALNSLSAAGSWIAAGAMQTDKTKESVTEFINELDNLGGKKPISAAELDAARVTRVRGFPQRFESFGSIAQRVADIWVHQLPLDEFKRELSYSKSLGLAEVNSAAASWAKRNQSMLLLVGDVRKIRPGLEALKAGEIVVLDKTGKPFSTGAGGSMK